MRIARFFDYSRRGKKSESHEKRHHWKKEPLTTKRYYYYIEKEVWVLKFFLLLLKDFLRIFAARGSHCGKNRGKPHREGSCIG